MSNSVLGFRVRSETAETIEIDLYDAVSSGWWGGVSAKQIRERIKGSKATTIKLRVNSPGGDVIEGFAIYNLLNEHPARVEVDVDGMAASIASIIIMAADEIRIAKNAFVMIHNPWAYVVGESADLRKLADVMDKMRQSGIDIYAARTGQSREKLSEMLDAETWMTADEAKALGFVDKVKPAKAQPKKQAKAQASMMMALDANGFLNVPAELRQRIEEARADAAQQPALPLDSGDDVQPVATSDVTEKQKMTTAILAALCVATEAEALNRIAILNKIEKATGKAGDEAHGACTAAVENAALVPGLQKQVADLQAQVDSNKLTVALAEAKAANKVTPAYEARLRAQIEAKEMTVSAAVALLSDKEPVAVLVNGATPKPAPVVSSTAAPVLKHEGKTWAEMKPMEKHRLHEQDPDLYAAMRDAAAK